MDVEAIVARIWPGEEPRFEVLGGGITNHNYKVDAAGGPFVLRIAGRDTAALGIDRSTLGHPGKFSYCIAEDEEDTTWAPLHVQRGLPPEVSAVTVMAAGAPRQIAALRILHGTPGLLLPHDVERAVLQLDVRVQLLAMQAFHQRLVLQLQQNLDQPRNTCRELKMADVALHRSQPAIRLAGR